MAGRWFDDKFEKNKVHSSTKRGSLLGYLIKYFLSSFFRNISVTSWLIFTNVILFIFFYIFLQINPGFVDYVALKPSLIIQGKNLWTLVTSMFMHASIGHLFVNMFSLFFVGTFVERLIGRKRFLILYFIAGIVGGLFFSLLPGFFPDFLGGRVFGSPDIVGVGASGAIFGLAGLLAVITPRQKIYMIAGPLIAVIAISILELFVKEVLILNVLNIIVSIYFFISLFAVFSFSSLRKIALPISMPFWLLPVVAIVPLVIIGLLVTLPIGNMAHLGGLVAGLIYGFYLRKKYRKKILILNRVLARYE